MARWSSFKGVPLVLTSLPQVLSPCSIPVCKHPMMHFNAISATHGYSRAKLAFPSANPIAVVKLKAPLECARVTLTQRRGVGATPVVD